MDPSPFRDHQLSVSGKKSQRGDVLSERSLRKRLTNPNSLLFDWLLCGLDFFVIGLTDVTLTVAFPVRVTGVQDARRRDAGSRGFLAFTNAVQPRAQ